MNRTSAENPDPEREGEGEIVFVPIVHGSMHFACVVHDTATLETPDCIAIELPETLTEPFLKAVRRLPLLSLLRYKDGENNRYVLIEPADGIIEAARYGVERGLPVVLVDRDSDAYGLHEDRLPDPSAVERIGYEAYIREVSESFEKMTPDVEDDLRERTMAFHLDRLRTRYQKILFVGGVAHTSRIRQLLRGSTARPLGKTKRSGIEVFHLAEESSREVLSEPGHVQAAFEGWRKMESTGSTLDSHSLTKALFVAARDRMSREDGERVSPLSIKTALRFARNQALLRRGLAPDLFESTIAARGVHSDDYAWHVWELGVSYPFQTERPEIPVVRLTLEELNRASRSLRFRKRAKTRRHALRLVRTRKKETRPGEWKENWKGDAICSYPPEDVRLEMYGAFLRKRAKGLLADERTKVVPFSTSLGDGIDVRETLRHRATDKRLYVRESSPVRGDVGAVVVIFDESETRYDWTMTWQGEHEVESDMALFATAPEEKFVGPGVAKSEYGGFLMTYPPGRMFHVFEDPFFAEAESKAERLLLAAIDYASDRWIVYVAKRPPRPLVVQRARRSGREVMFVPIGALSPATLRKIRVFHVLNGRGARDTAREYIE